MCNSAATPTPLLSSADSDVLNPFKGTHCMGKDEELALEVVPMREPGDPIFDNNHSSQYPHLDHESSSVPYAAPTIHPFYLDTFLQRGLFPTAYQLIHQDMGLPSFSHPLSQMSNTGVDNSPIDVLEEMEHQSVLQMTHVDRPASVSWSTFLDHDVVITWSGPSHAPANDDYDSSGSLSGLLEHTPPRSLTGAEDGESTPGPWITGVSPTPIKPNGSGAPPTSVLLLPIPINWCEIPQQRYTPKVGNRSLPQLQAVTFSVNGIPGFNMQRALNRAFAGLDGRDTPVLENANGPVSCRLLFPGYPMNTQCSQIAVKNWKKDPAPITKSKLAHEVAKRVYQYLDALDTIPIDPSAGLQWTIGEGCMKLEKMYLTNVSWVSRGSVQPEIWVDTGDS